VCHKYRPMADVVGATDTQTGSAHTGPNAVEPPKAPTELEDDMLQIFVQLPESESTKTATNIALMADVLDT